MADETARSKQNIGWFMRTVFVEAANEPLGTRIATLYRGIRFGRIDLNCYNTVACSAEHALPRCCVLRRCCL
jgi:hypothetical protein